MGFGVFLARTQETNGEIVEGNNTTTQAHQQRTSTTFFSPTTRTHATSQSRATQMGPIVKEL